MADLKDKFVNTKNKVVGEVKEYVGKKTNNSELELEGKIQSTHAELSEKVSDLKDHAAKKINSFVDKK
jgi:uncharacterized protein YjbJ (UPF0337 family)